jgi:ankyrin repeat protein
LLKKVEDRSKMAAISTALGAMALTMNPGAAVGSPGGAGISAARVLRDSPRVEMDSDAAASPAAQRAALDDEKQTRSSMVMIHEFENRKKSITEKLTKDKESRSVALKERLAERKRRIAAVKERQKAHDAVKKRKAASPKKAEPLVEGVPAAASPTASALPSSSPASPTSPTVRSPIVAAAQSPIPAKAAEPMKSTIVDMCEAAAYGQIERLKAVLARGSEDECDESHNTPLHYAAGYGRSKCVRLLINSGFGFCCSVDLQGCTPLFWACASNQSSVAKLLIKMDPDCIDYPNDIGDTPLHVAAQNRCGACLDLLLKSEADPNAMNDAQKPPAILAMTMTEEERAGTVGEGKWSSAELLRALLECGADPHALDENGSSLIHLAAARDCAESARALWEYHAWISPMAADARGRTAVHVAAELGSLNVLRFCIENDIDVFGLDTVHQTPQFVAEQYGQTEAVRLLAEHAAAYEQYNIAQQQHEQLEQHEHHAAYYEGGGGEHGYAQQPQPLHGYEQPQHQHQHQEQEQEQYVSPQQQQQHTGGAVGGGRYAQMLTQGRGAEPRGYHSDGAHQPGPGASPPAHSWRGGGYSSESVVPLAAANTDFLAALEVRPVSASRAQVCACAACSRSQTRLLCVPPDRSHTTPISRRVRTKRQQTAAPARPHPPVRRGGRTTTTRRWRLHRSLLLAPSRSRRLRCTVAEVRSNSCRVRSLGRRSSPPKSSRRRTSSLRSKRRMLR